MRFDQLTSGFIGGKWSPGQFDYMLTITSSHFMQDGLCQSVYRQFIQRQIYRYINMMITDMIWWPIATLTLTNPVPLSYDVQRALAISPHDPLRLTACSAAALLLAECPSTGSWLADRTPDVQWLAGCRNTRSDWLVVCLWMTVIGWSGIAEVLACNALMMTVRWAQKPEYPLYHYLYFNTNPALRLLHKERLQL